MIARIRSFDQLGDGLRLALQLWPLCVVWWVWDVSDDLWRSLSPLVTDETADLTGKTSFLVTGVHKLWDWLQPSGALLGPTAVMALAIILHRIDVGRRIMALAGVLAMAAAAILTGWSYYLRLLQPGDVGAPPVAIFVGLVVAYIGFCFATQVRRSDSDAPSIRRGASGNFGHADWLSMKAAHRRFPGPDPTYGGLVVGEAYRVDQDRAAQKTLFDPDDARTWGMGGKAPLLVDPCRFGSTHALVFAGSGGFKTTAVGIPTLLTWTGSAVVLDPSCEIAPMVQGYRQQTLGHRVVTLDPFTPGSGLNVLDWIDPAAPQAETHVDTVVRWICGETRDDSGSRFFSGRGRNLIRCLLADMLWDPQLSPDQKTLRTLRRRIVTPEDEMRVLLERIHQLSHSAKARDLAGTIKGAVSETFSGIYQNADEDTSWLSTAAFADLVSGSSFKTSDLNRSGLTVFVQIPMPVLKDSPAVGRVVIGALLNAVYEANARVEGRVLFLLDEVARLGYMHLLELARDAGRKYGVTLLMLYQSLGQLVGQWGQEGKQAWFDGTAWQLFAAVRDWDTARQVSGMCGEYGVVATSAGDTTSSQSGRTGTSSSAGRSENRSEIRRALIRPEELMHDARSDEAFVLAGGTKPLRCGRAIYFRRPEWSGLIEKNRFHPQHTGTA